MITVKPIDCFRMLTELRVLANMTHVDVARALGVTRSKVHGWYNGAKPNIDEGRAFIILHRRVIIAMRRAVRRRQNVEKPTAE